MSRAPLTLLFILLLSSPLATAGECRSSVTTDLPPEQTTSHSEDEILVTGIEYLTPALIREKGIKQLKVTVSDTENPSCSSDFCTVFTHEFGSDGNLVSTHINNRDPGADKGHEMTITHYREDGVLVDMGAVIDGAPESRLAEDAPYLAESMINEIQILIDLKLDFQEANIRYLPPGTENLELFKLEHAPSSDGVPGYAIAYPMDDLLNIDPEGRTLHVYYRYSY